MLQPIIRRIDILEKTVRRLITLTYRSEVTGGFAIVAYADLPTPNLTGGRAYYCSNCRKAGEGVGVGTGMIVVETNLASVATWVNVDNMTQAAQV